MPFDWQEFLQLAERLLDCQSEAAYRTAISRAYYSLFNLAYERAKANNCDFDPDAAGGMHKKCWGLYRKGPDPLCTLLGIEGSRLLEIRVRADYRKGEILRLSEAATQAITDVRLLRTRLAALDLRYPTP